MSHHDVAEVLECDTRKVKALVFQARTHLLGYRAARETPCADVRREIAARKRGAPTATIRRHVAVCDDCAEFRRQVREQRRALGLLLPVLPAAGLRTKALAAAGAPAVAIGEVVRAKGVQPGIDVHGEISTPPVR